MKENFFAPNSTAARNDDDELLQVTLSILPIGKERFSQRFAIPGVWANAGAQIPIN